MGLKSGFNLHFLLSWMFNSRGKTEVSDLDVHVIVEQHVSELQVSVDDVLSVDVACSVYELRNKVTYFRLC